MHSRIFEVVKVDDAVPEIGSVNLSEETISERNMPFCDYVDSMSLEDVKESFRWFSECESILFRSRNQMDSDRCFVITDDVKCDFFRSKYESFREKAEGLTLEKFAGADEGSHLLWELAECLDERFGFYIVSDYFGYPVTLDYFVRNVPEGRYALVWALDYHF